MKTILVVDDNPETLLCLEEMLTMSGHKVIACSDGRSALIAVYEGKTVDLVITDYSMPGMNGLEFIAELKKLSPQIPAIMCSAHLRADVYSKAIDLGAAGYLQKPVSRFDLEQALAETLGAVQQPL